MGRIDDEEDGGRGIPERGRQGAGVSNLADPGGGDGDRRSPPPPWIWRGVITGVRGGVMESRYEVIWIGVAGEVRGEMSMIGGERGVVLCELVFVLLFHDAAILSFYHSHCRCPNTSRTCRRQGESTRTQQQDVAMSRWSKWSRWRFEFLGVV